MKYEYKNLSLFGGGSRGIAHIGACKRIEELGIRNNIERVVGVSSGAIFGLLFSLGYASEEMEKIVFNTDFSKFVDSPGPFYIKCAYNMLRKFGLFSGSYFHKWMGDLIEEKTGNRHITFYDFEKKYLDLSIVATDLKSGVTKIFNKENTPFLKVLDCIRASMSLPFIYNPFKINDDLFVDGGVGNPTPIKIYDRECFIKENDSKNYMHNPYTLGFSLMSQDKIGLYRDREEPKKKNIKSFIDMVTSMLKIYIDQDNSYLNSANFNRTIFLDTLDIKTTQFDLSSKDKSRLIDSGYKSCERFFNLIEQDIINPHEAIMVRNNHLDYFNEKQY